MTEEQIEDVGVVEDVPEIDPAIVEVAMQQFASEQNLVGGVIAGLVAAVAGAAAWAVITVLTGYQIGWMAVGIGFLVGIAVRIVGKGLDKQFGIAGAVIALVGCLLGNILSVTYFVAQAESMGFFEVLSKLNPSITFELLTISFSPMDLLFYGIALYEGYRLSFRQITEEELINTISGVGGTIDHA